MNRSEAIETLKKAIAQVEWDYPMEIVAALDFAIADMKICEANNAGWISVKGKLPDNEQDVLAYLDNGKETRIAPCNYANGVWFDCVMNCDVVPRHVTHWMPLPDPPKEGSQV